MPTPQIEIRTADNNFQRLEVLKRNRHKRHQYGECFVEGVEAINSAAQFGWKFRALCYSRDRELSNWAKAKLDTLEALTVYSLDPELMMALSDKENPSELIAIVETKAPTLADIELSSMPCVAVFDRPMSPGNLGSNIRTCAAFNVNGIVICGHSCDLFDPLTLRSSIGTIFASKIVRIGSPKDLQSWVESLAPRYSSFQVIATSHEGNKDIGEIDFASPTILIFGNETTGVSEAFLELATASAKIPLAGITTSLNVSCATSIFLYELDRQRRKVMRNIAS